MQETASGAAKEPESQAAHTTPLKPGPLTVPGAHLVHQSVPSPDGQLAGHVPVAPAGLVGSEASYPTLPYCPILAVPGGQRSSLRDLVGDTLIIYPRAPRPSYADQVLALFHDRALEPASIYEARELQIALGLVAAGEGVSVVPRSVAGLQREDVSYMELDDPQLVSPIIFSTRLLDESEDIQAILNLTYRLYEEQKIPHYRPT